MLPNVCCHNGVLVRNCGNGVNGSERCQLGGILCLQLPGVLLEIRHMRHPLRMCLLRQLFCQPSQNLPHRTGDSQFYGDILPDFRSIDIDVNDLCVAGILCGVAGTSVAEAAACGDDQVCFILAMEDA